MIHTVRTGTGKPLLLVHGLGNTHAVWNLILPMLAGREVIAIDLPGHGATPADADSGTFAGLARGLDAYLASSGLAGVDMVGSSLGARLVLEMARRGRAGGVVSLSPGGFWQGWERGYLKTTLTASVALLRTLKHAVPAIAGTAAGRTALMLQLSAKPWALDGKLLGPELVAMANTRTIVPLIRDLADGPLQEGPAAPGTGPIIIGWGRHDKLLFPSQATRAVAAFPGARLHWFNASGHFPMLDEPAAAGRLIRESLG